MSIRLKKAITFVLIIICLILCGFVAFLIYEKQQEAKAEREEREKIMAVQVNNSDMPEEYRELKAFNSDVYGWLVIEGTDISYPILQSSEDNAYYLSHDAHRNESEQGAIFSENYNTTDFSDFLTVLYGNCMEDGTMFGGLLEYEDPVYFENHRNIKIILPDKTLDYYIFASYTGDNAHLLLTRDLSKEENRKKYISQIFKQRGLKNTIDKTVDVNTNSNILALSTGHPSDENSRFIIQAIRK